MSIEQAAYAGPLQHEGRVRARKGASRRVAESRVARFSRVVKARVAAPRLGATQPTLPASGTGPTAQAAEPGAGFLLPVARARRSEGRCDSGRRRHAWRRPRAGKGLEIIAGHCGCCPALGPAGAPAGRSSRPAGDRRRPRNVIIEILRNLIIEIS